MDHRLSPGATDHLTPEYLKMNPNGVVPTLLHDGDPILDSSVIIEYLDEVFPEVKLTPIDPKERDKKCVGGYVILRKNRRVRCVIQHFSKNF